MATAFIEDDYTGRMGPDGEPERYSTMRGGDPRVKQRQELAERERRLQEPFVIDNYLKSISKDIRGTKAASEITLNPGTQYRIRDYSGKKNGEIIASGSTPEEFLMLQDVARGLARQGTNADYRLEQVGGEPTQNFGQYRDPSSGEVVSVIGGDLYNKPIAGDIIKIALPAALALIPGVGPALAAKTGLAAKGTLGAKMIGAGLASGIGRTAAGVLTGDPVLDSLKAGAISGLGSAATAGLLDKIGVDKALGSAFSGTKGALAGEATSKGISEAAKKLAEEGLIEVVASRIAPSLVSSGISAAGGSLLGDIGKSIAQPDQFQQALDQARLDNEFGLGDTVVTGSRLPTGQVPLAGVLPGAPEGIRFIASPAEVAGQAPAQQAEAPADEDIDVTGKRIGKVTLPPPSLPAAAVSDVITKYKPPEPVESLIEKQAKKIDDADEITVTAEPIKATGSLGAALPGLAMTLPAMTAAQAISTTGAQPPSDKKGMSTLDKVSAGLAIAGAVADAVGGDGGGGTIDPGTGYTVPGAGSGIGRTRNVATFDPFTYGQKGGEFAFFGDGMAEGGEVDDDMVKHLVEYRKGGGHMGPGQVKGIGSGQDDKIPAWLSDGEYVWSAQDVADLGDGSTDEGVRRLDKMRQMVRKGAGRKDVKKIAKPQRGIEDMLKAVGGAV
jgi:hypothetical protein